MDFDDNTIKDFWSKVDIKKPNECWLWAGKNDRRYGYYRHNGRSIYAHRMALIVTVGLPEVAKSDAMHSCDVKLCCNPQHLSWGSRKQNMVDARDHGLIKNVKLNRNLVANIKWLALSNPSTQILAELYSIDPKTVRQIRDGETWVDVIPVKPEQMR